MRAVIQRVSQASVTIDNSLYSHIKHGLLILLGVEHADSDEDVLAAAQDCPQLCVYLFDVETDEQVFP